MRHDRYVFRDTSRRLPPLSRLTQNPVTPGYIYILQNEALAETHLKIGRTTVDPHGRAEEISRSTGVPSPFFVAWSSRTDDCVLAERIVHQRLAYCRTNPRREFFDIELSEAISAAKIAVSQARQKSSFFGGFQPAPCRQAVNSEVGETWSFLSFLFHSVFRPIARFPAEVVIFLSLITVAALKIMLKVAVVIIGVSAKIFLFLINLALIIVGAFLSGLLAGAKPRRRRKPWWP